MTQEELNVALIRAVRAGNLQQVEELYAQGADITQKDNEGWTPLHFACRYSNNRYIVSRLLARGADITQKNKGGATPLHLACCNANLEVVICLLKKGSDITQKDNEGWTPLHFACRYGNNPDIVSRLLEQGADITQKDNEGWTPLHFACRYANNPDVVRLLIEKGADITQKDTNGETPLHIACRYANNPDVVRLLIEKGADITQKDTNGETPLHIACRYGNNPDVVRLLIEKGANPDQGDKNGWTSLHAASLSGHHEIVRLLIEKGADITQKDMNGETPLFFVQDANIADFLIDKYADVNHQDNYGNTPLHQVSNIDMARILIKKGANVHIRNSAGFTPLETIRNEEVRAYLQDVIAGQRQESESENNRTVNQSTTDSNGSDVIVVKNQVRHVNVNTLPIPRGPEYGYSAAPVTEEEIRDFCQNYINFEPNTEESREIMRRGLREVCRVPTGCMAFRATCANIQEQRKINSSHRMNVEFSKFNSNSLGCHYTKSRKIEIFMGKIQSLYSNQSIANFVIGETFLHEAMHDRQSIRDPNSTIQDAPTQALSRQLYLESPYDKLRTDHNIGREERSFYEQAVKLQENGAYTAETAQRYSAYMQSIYINEFMTKPEENPIVHYGFWVKKWSYMYSDIHNCLFCNSSGVPLADSYRDLQTRFDVILPQQDIVQNQIFRALQPLGEQVLAHCSRNQIQAIYNAIKMSERDLDANLFSENTKQREIAINYLGSVIDIKDKFLQLANLSIQIYDNPNNSSAISSSIQIRRELREKYGIVISTHNQLGERVANTIDIVNKDSSSTIEGILRQNQEQGVGNNIIENSSTNNCTLASNSGGNITNVEQIDLNMFINHDECNHIA